MSRGAGRRLARITGRTSDERLIGAKVIVSTYEGELRTGVVESITGVTAVVRFTDGHWCFQSSDLQVTP